MTATLTPVPKFQALTNAGEPLVGGRLYSYQAGTTTPLATYTDSTEVTPNTNPVILDARGEAAVWLAASPAYKLVLKDSLDTEIWSVDNIESSGYLPSVLASTAEGEGVDLIGGATKTVVNSAAVRALTAATTVSSLIVLGSDGGLFRRDSTDTTSAEDGGSYCGTVIRSTDYATRGVWKRVYSTPYICGSWFGMVPDYNGTTGTDNKPLLQAAINSGKSLAVCIDVRGRYYFSGSVTYSDNLTLFSSNVWMFPKTIQETSFETDTDDYILAAATNKLCLVTQGLHWNAANAIDIRPTTIAQIGENKIYAQHSSFESATNDYGIAIMAGRSDFSTIENCNFYAFKGLCGVRFGGNINDSGSGNYSNSYLATALTLRKNVFSEDCLIPISVEMCNSVLISDTDIGAGSTTNMYCAIDIGGFRYNTKVAASSKYATAGTFYNRASTENGGPNAFTFATVSFAGSGRFNSVKILGGNIEAGASGEIIHAEGTANNYGRDILIGYVNGYNGTGVDGTTFVNAVRVRGLRTLMNEFDAVALSTTNGISYTACTNPRLLLDRITTSSGAFTGALYVDGGSNSNVALLPSASGSVTAGSNPTFSGFYNSDKQINYTVSGDKGDNNFSWTAHSSENVIFYNSPLTANRTVTLTTVTSAFGRVRVVRGGGATGAFNLTVNGKNLTAAGTWIEFARSATDSTWLQVGYGALL